MSVTISKMSFLPRFMNISFGCLPKYVHTAVQEKINHNLLNSFNIDVQHGGVIPVFRRALLFPSRVAVQDELGIYTYAGLHQAASALCLDIEKELLGESGQTIAYLCGNDASHVITQWAIWMSGNIAVPLSSLHPPAMIKYFLEDSLSRLVLCKPEYEQLLKPVANELKRPVIVTSMNEEVSAQLYQPESSFDKQEDDKATLNDVGKSSHWYADADAMIIYTSGTTSKPKGVVWTHAMWTRQIAALHSAWQYAASDVVLHTLPLHHIHGQLNSLSASLAAGARVRMQRSFVSHAVWARLLGMGERKEQLVTAFHGVPAMYARLVQDYDKLFGAARTREYVRATLRDRVRLMCAGSAPLPQTLFQRWEEISGQKLLERYGMSEVGMALSNPYRPEEGRERGCVGLPLPGISARLAKPDTLQPLLTVETPPPEMQISLEELGLPLRDADISEPSRDMYQWKPPVIARHADDEELQGELLIKGPSIFKRYWNRSSVNSKDWTPDGWFITGDIASFTNGKFQIMGRSSVDIIKTGGYKVSALQVESVLLEHPKISDVAVIGLPDQTLGEKIAALVVTKPKEMVNLPEIKHWARERLAPYQVPTVLLVKDSMPRNIMGKLDKKVILDLFTNEKK